MNITFGYWLKIGVYNRKLYYLSFPFPWNISKVNVFNKKALFVKSKFIQFNSFFFKTSRFPFIFLFEGLPISWSDIAKSTRKQHQCNLCDRRSKQQIGKESLLRWTGRPLTWWVQQCLRVNHGCFKYFRYSRQQLQGKSFPVF